jgi:hypothetical protein
MTFPVVTEIPQKLEPVGRDTFADSAERTAAASRAGSWAAGPAPLANS